MQLLASAWLEVQRCQRRQLEESLAKLPAEDLLLYVDASNYDETPMPVVARDLPTQQELETDASQLVLVESSSGSIVIPSLQCSSIDKAKMPTKILQSHQHFVALVRLRNQEGSLTGYAITHGDAVNWLQRLDNTKGSTVAGALERTCAVTEHANAFRHRWRICCTDDAKSNPAAEKLIITRRNRLRDGWKAWRAACEVHKVSTCFNTTFSVVDLCISGILNASLSVNLGAHIPRLRRIIESLIRANLVFRTTPLDNAAETFKMHILRIFCASGRKVAFRVGMLVRLLPGDWRNRNKVEYILQPGESPEEVRQKVPRWASMVLVSSKFQEWPRHRWTGADIALSQWGLLDAVHGLLSWSYPTFVASFGSEDRRRSDMPDTEPMDVEPTPDSGGLPAASSAAPAAAAGLNSDGAEANVGPQPVPAQVLDDGLSAEANKRFRTAGMKWVASQPLWQMIMIRLIMQPLKELLEFKLWVGSEVWELVQSAAAAMRQSDNSSDCSGSWPNRDFAACLASKNVAEDKCIGKLESLLDAGMWLSMPNSSLLESCQAQVFVLMSRVGCMAEELLRQRHRLAPWIVFRILWDPDAAAQILEMPRCLLDELMLDLVADGNFDGLEARLKVFCIAICSRTDVSNVEALHAWVRKRIVKRVQTQSISMEDLGAQWVFGRS